MAVCHSFCIYLSLYSRYEHTHTWFIRKHSLRPTSILAGQFDLSTVLIGSVIIKNTYTVTSIRTCRHCMYHSLEFRWRHSNPAIREWEHSFHAHTVCIIYLNFSSAHRRIITRKWVRQSCGACLPRFGSVLRIRTVNISLIPTRIWIWGSVILKRGSDRIRSYLGISASIKY